MTPKSTRFELKESSWVSDASMLDVNSLENLIFENQSIRSFLTNTKKFFVAANKGMGKTLLLSFKRYLLYKNYASGSQGSKVKFIPSNSPFLDYMGDLPDLSKEYHQYLSNLKHAKQIWNISLKISILSHINFDLAKHEIGQIDKIPKPISSWILEEDEIPPSNILQQLLVHFTPSQISKHLDQYNNFLDTIIRRLHTGIFIFIDKVDQAIKSFPKQAWIIMQAGLIEAAWDIVNSNPHIKIYATVRQEAFSNYHSDIKSNLIGSTTIIDYKRSELAQIMDKLSQYYEGKTTFQRFTGIEKIKSPLSGEVEDSFDYVLRHTIGRPRDLVIISSNLSENIAHLQELEFRAIVNQVSEQTILPNIFNEVEIFLECLKSEMDRQRFFSLLPGNIISKRAALRISCLFNGINEEDYAQFDDPINQMNHPFSELYKSGLLGYETSRNGQENSCMQRFKQPYDMSDYSSIILPNSDFYFIHPALQNTISQAKREHKYLIFKYVTVGHAYSWSKVHKKLVEIQMTLEKIRRKGSIKNREEVCTRVIEFIETHLSKLHHEHDILNSTAYRELVELLESSEGYTLLHLELEDLICANNV
ncbi:MAG: hypothetical protein AAFX87_07280 [Bacteroidota bacterium]